MNDRSDTTDTDQPSRRGALIAMVLIAAALVGGYALTRKLSSNAASEDCLMAGRKNCAPIVDGVAVAPK